MKSERQLIDVAEARGYVETFMADPILKMAANAVLNNTPRVDAVEVVRCKKCIHWKDDVAGCTGFVHRCAIANYMVGATGYCVYAERKAEDGNFN